MRTRLLFLSLSLLLIVPFANGQKLKFSRLTSEDGLSQSSVNCVIEDDAGYIWFGTQDGLNRYDGYKFTVYRNTPGDPTTINDKYIRCLLLGKNNELWVGSNKGLNKYNKLKDAWESYRFVDGQDREVLAIHQLQDGTMWIGTNNGLFSYKPGDEQASYVRAKDELKEFFKTARVTSFLQDKSGKTWVGTNSGLYWWNQKGGNFVLHNIDFQADADNPIVQSKDKIRKLYQDEKGDIWIGTLGAGLLKLDPASNNIQVYNHVDDDSKSISYNAVTALLERRPGELWVGTSDQLNVYRSDMPGVFNRYSADTDGDYVIANNEINCIYKDRSGIIWIGTNGGGVSVFKELSNQFQHFNKDNFAIGCMRTNAIMGFSEDKNGKLWFATYGEGLISYDPRTEECTRYPFPTNKIHRKILCLYCASDGRVWIGSHGGGVNYFDPATGEFSNPYTNDHPDSTKRITSNDILCITEDGSKNIWIGTLRGLNKLDRSTGVFAHYYTENGLAGNFVNDLYYYEAKKQLWIGTTRGLSLMDLPGESVSNYTHDPENVNSISNNYVFCIHNSGNGTIWLGTAAGLNAFNVSNSSVTSYTRAEGLPNDNVYGILEDKTGALWLSTNKGLIKLNPPANTEQSLDYKHYVEQDGMQSNEFNQGAFLKTSAGQMFFGGMEGFNAFFPDKIKTNNQPPKIHFTSFKLFDKEVALDTVIGRKRFIELSYKDRFFSFEFVALDYNQPSKVLYSWKLEGLEDEWKVPTTRRYATYNNLKGGDYIFRVRACNSDGLWNDEGIEVHIRVIPPFWETTWFRILAVLVIAAGVFIFIRVRTEKIKRENKILEEKVEERTRELNEKNEEIIASIMYAKRIQEAILPPKELIYKHFPNAFVLYEPKDIVSGDFYWFGVKDNKEIIAAVDCTGHGVPGAFMSMIGSNLLQQVIVENNITDPGKILTELNARVKSALKQDDESGVETADGMDLALCTIDKSKNLIEYAGAFRPLYMVRNGEVLAFKADKAPIGGGRYIDAIEFTNNQIEYQPGDAIYMFSDGYADQFGGERGKKFMAKRFRDLLLDVNNKSMEEQGAELKAAFTEWQGVYEQVDDVLVIGIQL